MALRQRSELPNGGIEWWLRKTQRGCACCPWNWSLIPKKCIVLAHNRSLSHFFKNLLKESWKGWQRKAGHISGISQGISQRQGCKKGPGVDATKDLLLWLSLSKIQSWVHKWLVKMFKYLVLTLGLKKNPIYHFGWSYFGAKNKGCLLSKLPIIMLGAWQCQIPGVKELLKIQFTMFCRTGNMTNFRDGLWQICF